MAAKSNAPITITLDDLRDALQTAFDSGYRDALLEDFQKAFDAGRFGECQEMYRKALTLTGCDPHLKRLKEKDRLAILSAMRSRFAAHSVMPVPRADPLELARRGDHEALTEIALDMAFEAFERGDTELGRDLVSSTTIHDTDVLARYLHNLQTR
jgi:hypothetical protein